jgi:hypothetical protein
MAVGCGYTTQELYPTQYTSVAVPIADNRTFYRGVEFDLTEAIIKEIEQRTPYKVVAPAMADTLLQITVTGIEQRQLNRTRDAGLPQELEADLRADLIWKDQSTGEVLVDRRGMSAVGRYIPTQPIGEPFETAQHAAVQRMAEQFVSEMRSDW